jgi:hypothetical protein
MKKVIFLGMFFSIFSAFASETVKGPRNCNIVIGNSEIDDSFREDLTEILTDKGFTVVDRANFFDFSADFTFSFQVHYQSWTSHTPDFLSVTLDQISPQLINYETVARYEDKPSGWVSGLFNSNDSKILKGAQTLPECVR